MMIETGRLLRDQHGRVAQLHGVGVLAERGRFWAWGEDKSAGSTFTAIACYSSDDLIRWTFEGNSLQVDEGDLGPDRVVERPKVLRHPATGRYVMFLHVDTTDYNAARLGFAVSESPAGPYTYLGSGRPLGNLSRDIGVFADDDGTGLLLSEDREHGLHIYRLAPDYLSVESVLTTTFAESGGYGYESPAMVKVDGVYYLFGSDLTGWRTNDNKYSVAVSPEGPWAPWRDFAPPGTATFDSQISTIITVPGTERVSHVYIGDRWNSQDLYHSAPVWLPLEIGDGVARLRWAARWAVDVRTGLVACDDEMPVHPCAT